MDKSQSTSLLLLLFTIRHYIFLLFLPVEPSELQLLVNKVAAHAVQRIYLERGAKVSLKCKVKAEPKPSVTWMVPGTIINITVSGTSLVSGRKWQRTLVIRSMSCRNSGIFHCLPKNGMGLTQKSVSVAIGVKGLLVTRFVILNFRNNSCYFKLWGKCFYCVLGKQNKFDFAVPLFSLLYKNEVRIKMCSLMFSPNQDVFCNWFAVDYIVIHFYPLCCSNGFL